MRVGLDTHVLVAALRSDRGASRLLLNGALDRRYAVLLSVPLGIGYEAVLTRPEHLEASGISAEDVGVILDALVAVSTPVRLSFLWRPALPDPGDDVVLETAVNGGADLLVTFNRRHFSGVAGQFQVTIVAPGEAVKRLGGST